MSDDLTMDLAARVAELERRLHDTIIYGVVSQVQLKPYRVRVDYGTPDAPQTTALLPVMVSRAAAAMTWWPLENGESVMVISPNGNTQQGRVIPATYSESHSQPDDQPDRLWVEFGQGNRLSLDRAGGKLKLILTEEVELNIGQTTLSLKKGAATLTTPALDINQP